jgi:DNA polymerase-3 subunit epsilon
MFVAHRAALMWWTGKALGFDLETDGRDPADARIITAATVRIGDGAPEEHEVLVQPERDIPAEATSVHGITTEHAREHGKLREAAIPAIAATMAEALGPEVPMVGHNASYDLTVLDREMRRTGVGRLETDRAAGHQVVLILGRQTAAVFPVIDTYVLDKAVDRYRPGKRRLEVAAAHYGVAMAEGSAHGATADVVASLRIAITIANRCGMESLDEIAALYADRKYPKGVARAFYEVGEMTLSDLHAAQVRWAREQAVGLKEHFIKQGKTQDAATVDGSWPLRTLTDGASPVETVDTTLV